MSMHYVLGQSGDDLDATVHSVNPSEGSVFWDRLSTLVQRSGVSSFGSSKTFQLGQTVFWQGDAVESCFLVKSGMMRGVRFLDDGRRQVTRFIFPGTLIVHKGHKTHPYSGEAVTTVNVQTISCEVLDQLIGEMPCFTDLVMQSVTEELSETQDHLLVLGKLIAEERVVHFLSDMKRKLPPGENGEIIIPMCRTDVADYLGLTVETVCRVFNRLKRQGKIVMLTSNRISVKDPCFLERQYQSFAA